MTLKDSAFRVAVLAALRDKLAELLEVHQIEWIDSEVGYDCGCNERGDDLGDLTTLRGALRHQADALLPVIEAHAQARVDGALNQAAAKGGAS